MARLSAVPREALPADQRRFYDAVRAIRRHPISGPFIVTMNSSPDLAARIAHLGHYFHARGQGDESIVSIHVRSFISVIGSRALDAPYEWSAWVNWALEAGIAQDTVDAVRDGRPPKLTGEQALVAELCTQLISGDHRVKGATFQAALERYGAQGLVELVVTLGYFALIALPLNAFEMEMSAEQLKLRKPFVPLQVGPPPATEQTRADLPPLSGRKRVARLRLLTGHDDVPSEHQHFLDRVVRSRGWIAPAFAVLLHTPDVAERISHIGAFLLYEGMLPPAIRALTGLIAARELDSDYVWAACAGMARASGIDGGVLQALEMGGALAGAGKEHRVLADFCRQLLGGNHHVSEATYQATVAQFGVPATVQIAVTLGYFVMMAVIANAFEVPPADDAERPAL